jgi:hypothetical protein
MEQPALIQLPPPFCQYAGGPCDQDFSSIERARGLFLFGSRPPSVAAAIETAKGLLDGTSGRWRTWRDLDIAGRIIFCEIGKAIRGAETVFADVTTLNFNLLFEIGYCIGLGIPVRPIRDTTYAIHERDFKALGVLDTLGYIDFTNGENLAAAVKEQTGPSLGHVAKKTYRDSPIYFLRGPIATEGTVRIASTLKKSPLNFRVHDPEETPRVSFHLHWKQVRGSYGVVANLLSPNRRGALIHNALCAFLCGIAMAEQKAVLMLQEEEVEQPIDYRDLVQPWEDPREIPTLMAPLINQVIERMQDGGEGYAAPPVGLLDQLDPGDLAAENEIVGLRDYFVPTGQFRQALRGHARLIVGRKGAGKTAMFYGLRASVTRGLQTLVLDMRPEGHQFTRLREAVLAALSQGQQEYTISAFWTYLLSAELAHKILYSPSEYNAAQRDPMRFKRYEALRDAYVAHGLESADDLSQRFLRQVDRLVERFGEAGAVTPRTDLAELVFGGDVRSLNDAVAAYVTAEKDEVWLLIDNLDKSWATRGATPEDVMLLVGLLEATRLLERQMQRRDVDLRCLVFIRPDVLEQLHASTPDRGKESAINLDWDDPELFREIVRQRVISSTDLAGTFDEVWRQVADPAIGAEDSFGYLVDRTLMRPRDVILFLQRALQVALNRGNQRISHEDILHAELGYSEEMLLSLGYEIQDTHPHMSDSLYAFHGAPPQMTRAAVDERLKEGNVPRADRHEALELLLWFGFLGVRLEDASELYSHTVQFNLRRLIHPVDAGRAVYVVHPTFRSALAVAQAS